MDKVEKRDKTNEGVGNKVGDKHLKGITGKRTMETQQVVTKQRIKTGTKDKKKQNRGNSKHIAT